MAKIRIKSGIMHKMDVLDMQTGEKVGYGYLVCDSDGHMSDPILTDMKGDRLGQEWFNLKFTTEEWPVTFPTRSQ